MLPSLLLKVKFFFRRSWQGIRFLPKLSKQQVLQILSRLTKKDFYTLTALTVVLVASGSFLIFNKGSQNGPNYGGEIIEGVVGQPQYINPVLSAASGTDTDLSRIVFAQLLKFDKELKLVADLAESLPTVSADQKTYTLKLKSNLKWQDGKPITAEDILFTIQTIQNAEYESPLRANFARVKVEKVDDLSVIIRLRESSAPFITNFTLGIIPKHIWGDSPPSKFRLSDRNLKPVGSGPFIVDRLNKTSDGTIKSLTLKRNELYHGGRPYLSRMTFKFYGDYESLLSASQAREIQNLGFIPFDKKAFLSESPKVNQYRMNLPVYQAVFFNLPKNQVLAAKAVRQALWLATDRKAIINEVYLGLAHEAYGPVVTGNLGYNPEVEKITHYNLAEAADILKRGGWTLDEQTKTYFKLVAKGKEKVRQNLEFNLVTNNFILNVKTAEILKNQWAGVGAKVHLVIVSPQELEQQYIRSRNFDALLFSENTGADPDPFVFWHSSQSRDPGLNLSGFSNAEADKLLTLSRSTNDVNVRSKNYQQFQLIITGELPAIFLTNAVYVYNVPKKIKGIDLTTIIHPSERFLDIRNWHYQ